MDEIDSADKLGFAETVSFSTDQYAGQTARIESIETRMMEDKFKNGNVVGKLLVHTEVLGTVEGKKGNIELRASEVFNLSRDPVTGKWGIPTDDRSNLKKFLASKGVNHPRDLVGKHVVVRKRGKYLGFYKN